MPGSRLRMGKLARLIANGWLDPSLMITHKFDGFKKIPGALERMHNKPVVYCDDID
ncbi:hypothetical protein [Limosilactobacillus oris]|jgi:threonine dehydrogenase-like Zn-dependent dehydrogenase|uniref:hypothetical protein n=1 Tax=Limosilactobacillus oris TaxID=1632 RepID=UPI00223556DE|nr:hypothetical protein [Limosilactobacillus oris]MCW4388710.1 hypothetical protein [Limosilactobacillus oris]